jgi:hypothetical protein
VLGLARDRAGVTADARALVDREPVLHGPHPSLGIRPGFDLRAGGGAPVEPFGYVVII